MNKQPVSGGFGNKKPFSRTRFDSLDDTFKYPGLAGKVVVVRGDESGLTAQDEAIVDAHTVKVSGTDTTPGYLIGKLEAAIEQYFGGLTQTVQDPAGDERQKIGINAIHPTIDIDTELNAPRVADGSLSTSHINSIWHDPAPYIAGLRSLGTLSNQAAAGTDPRFTDDRTPTVHAFGGDKHSTSQIAAIQAKVGDGFLITSDPDEFTGVPQIDDPSINNLVLMEDGTDGYTKKCASLSALPQLLRNSALDGTRGFLSDKLLAGTAISITENTTDPEDFKSEISVNLGTQTDQAAAGSDSRFTRVRVTAADTTPGYLDDKIETAGLISITATGLTQTVQDPAANEKLQLAINAVHESIGLDLILNAPKVNAQSIDSSYVKPANIDGTPSTPSLRTLGTLTNQACAGGDSRLSDARTPTAHKTTHIQGGSDAFALNGTGSPPSASGLPDGTLYFKYTA